MTAPATAQPDSSGPGGPFTGLREWLDRLQASGRLAVAKPGISLEFELAAAAKRMDGQAATFFPKPSGHPIPVISGLLSNRRWMAEALAVEETELLRHFQEAVASPLPWREQASGPVHEVVHRDVDLAKLLPLPVHNERDSGPYITAGLLIARNPRTGVQNVTIHRLQLNAKDRLGVLMLPRHTMEFYRMATDAAEDLPVTIVIGVDPATLLSSQAIVPLDFDELTIAGALHGKPLDVVRSLTNEIRVPANAEISIEGRILAGVMEPEGPFGEFPQYYGERADQQVIKVEVVTHRSRPIFHTIVGGVGEHLLLGGIPREATLLAILQRAFPGVRDVHLSRGGVCRYHLYVQFDKKQDGEAKNVIVAALGAHYDIKHVYVVDRDVNIHDPAEVEWAVATRFQGDRDLVIVNEAQGSKLDPSTRAGVGTKLGFDATVPLNARGMRFERIRVPGEADVDLDTLFERAASTSWRWHLEAD